jgi:hypothetical protein
LLLQFRSDLNNGEIIILYLLINGCPAQVLKSGGRLIPDGSKDPEPAGELTGTSTFSITVPQAWKSTVGFFRHGGGAQEEAVEEGALVDVVEPGLITMDEGGFGA